MPERSSCSLSAPKPLITVAGAIIGMGIGAFITVSWALATDIVPANEAARYLGIANIATCIGSGVARLLGGVLIDPINKALGSSSSGYLLLFALATICFPGERTGDHPPAKQEKGIARRWVTLECDPLSYLPVRKAVSKNPTSLSAYSCGCSLGPSQWTASGMTHNCVCSPAC